MSSALILTIFLKIKRPSAEHSDPSTSHGPGLPHPQSLETPQTPVHTGMGWGCGPLTSVTEWSK